MAMHLGTGWLVSAMVLVAACAGSSSEEPGGSPVDPATLDTDGDGLSDGEEADLGSDPAVMDTDEDGLDDGAEVTAGTDVTKKDSDDDGYLDADELSAGTDALDAASVIYQGGWPYNREKGALENPTFFGPRGTIEIGGRFPDLVGVDQHGELVHLYDFAGHGKPVVLDFSAQWCVPCMYVADYLVGNNETQTFDKVRDAVWAGDVYWITVMSQNVEGGPPTGVTSQEWASDFPDERIPVLSPPNASASMHYIDLAYFPSAIWLDEDMTVVDFNNLEPYQALDSLDDAL